MAQAMQLWRLSMELLASEDSAVGSIQVKQKTVDGGQRSEIGEETSSERSRVSQQRGTSNIEHRIPNQGRSNGTKIEKTKRAGMRITFFL
jgi:hypothetical protein